MLKQRSICVGIALMIFLSFAGGALLVGLIAAAAIWQLGRNSHWLADRPGWRILLLALLCCVALGAAAGAAACGCGAVEVFRAMRDIF